MGKGNRQLKGISYGRVSTINQVLDSRGGVREDASPAAQKIRCEEHAKFLTQKTGYEYKIIHHISEEGFSAKNVKRPGYQQMWRMIEARSVDFVIASELSRLSRSVTDFLDLVTHCQKHDVDLIIIGLDLDSSTPFGRVMVVILVALAQFEREMTSMRVKENALTRLIKDGKINGGCEILGLDRDPKHAGHYLPNSEELKTVEKVMKIFLQAPGKATVLRKIKKMGIKGKHGRELNKHALTLLLENAKWRYRGLWFANKENKDKDQELIPENRRYQEVRLPHGPLLDLKLLDEVSQKLTERGAEKPRERKSKVVDNGYLLSGILVHEDGGRFTGEYAKGRGGTYRYYHNQKKKMRLSCDEIDNLVRNTVKEYFSSSQECRQIVRRGYRALQDLLPEIETKADELDAALAALKKKENELKKALTLEKLGDPVFSDWIKEQVHGISTERSRIESELGTLQSHRANLLNQSKAKAIEADIERYIEDGFEAIPRQAQRTIIERIIPKVIIKSNNQMEVKIAIPLGKADTNEDKSSISGKNGGRDGT